MITLIPHAFTGPMWQTIDLGDNASIEIAIRRPTLGEQLIALDDSQSSREYQLRAYIADWRGVNDPSGKPIPYSWDMLNQLCIQYPEAFYALLAATRNVRMPDPGDDEKKSELPPSDGGTATNGGTTSLMTSSDSVADSAESSGSAAVSD